MGKNINMPRNFVKTSWHGNEYILFSAKCKAKIGIRVVTDKVV
jgi:hypothetical protein